MQRTVVIHLVSIRLFDVVGTGVENISVPNTGFMKIKSDCSLSNEDWRSQWEQVWLQLDRVAFHQYIFDALIDVVAVESQVTNILHTKPEVLDRYAKVLQ